MEKKKKNQTKSLPCIFSGFLLFYIFKLATTTATNAQQKNSMLMSEIKWRLFVFWMSRDLRRKEKKRKNKTKGGCFKSLFTSYQDFGDLLEIWEASYDGNETETYNCIYGYESFILCCSKRKNFFSLVSLFFEKSYIFSLFFSFYFSRFFLFDNAFCPYFPLNFFFFLFFLF